MSRSIGISDELSNCNGVLLYLCDINHFEKSIEKNFLLIRICGLMDNNVDWKIAHFLHTYNLCGVFEFKLPNCWKNPPNCPKCT